ncbi:hypothetical protein BZL30_3036 [Mycobacterium kansasii]|uniref:Uncharacterized protein n=1 Tax=Mycobacterium kansasii TaxID=1768 RepID=A0A1V3XK28_MYCKA|nr:hypothetical protein BZL30_3036 [Mycobacterium kansasii]
MPVLPGQSGPSGGNGTAPDGWVEPVEQHPYWEATGAVTFRDPDGREVVFAPFVYGVNEPADSSASGIHEFPSS